MKCVAHNHRPDMHHTDEAALTSPPPVPLSRTMGWLMMASAIAARLRGRAGLSVIPATAEWVRMLPGKCYGTGQRRRVATLDKTLARCHLGMQPRPIDSIEPYRPTDSQGSRGRGWFRESEGFSSFAPSDRWPSWPVSRHGCMEVRLKAAYR